MKVIIIVIFLLYFINVVALPLPYGHYKIIFLLFVKNCTEPGLQRMKPARCSGLVSLGVNTFRKTVGSLKIYSNATMWTIMMIWMALLAVSGGIL